VGRNRPLEQSARDAECWAKTRAQYIRERAVPVRAHLSSDALREPLHACANGELAPNVALARLIVLANTKAEAEAALAAAQRERTSSPQAERIAAAVMLWRGTPSAWDTVKRVLDAADHDGMALSVPAWAARFDSAARVSPEASAALYSLGRADLLDAAAHSVVRRLRAWGLTGEHRAVLDLGCGCGRLSAALAPFVHRVVGVDVSAGMLSAARARCRGLANVSLLPISGEDLSAFAEDGFDLVMAVDVFPYLVSCADALAERHMREAFRVLTPGGALVILNYAYGPDAAAEARGAIALAQRAGLQLVRTGRGDFELWDGRTFHFRRPEV
jgi:SAM-dependent methyltransferase